VVGHHENFVEHESHAESSLPVYAEAPIEVHSHHEPVAGEVEAEKLAESLHASETPMVEERHEAESTPALAPTTENKSWDNTWEAGGTLPAEKFAEMTREEVPVVEKSGTVVDEERVTATEGLEEPAPMIAQVAEGAVVEGEREKPDMDALVARVIDQMNPEVLKKMTHEFLRPVIAAVIEEELKSKKS
jgi:hypothetical protein